MDRGQYDDPVEVFWASGVCILIRRAALADTGGLDEVMFCYMEEIDLCWRLHLMGWRVGYVPTAIVYHIGYYSLDMRVVRRMYLNHRNSMIMLIKNYSARSLAWILPIKIGLELFILTGALLRNPQRSRAVLLSFGWLALHVPTRAADAAGGAGAAPRCRMRRSSSSSTWGWRRSGTSSSASGRSPTFRTSIGVLHRPLHPGQKPREGEQVHPERRDFLYAYLDQAPTGLALMRAVECDLFAHHAFERPILDVGCGDGTFARMLFNGVIVDAAVDADPQEAERARATRCYAEVRVGNAEALPFESGAAASVLCNSVLAMVPDCDAALSEIHRVLRPGGRVYLTVPSPRCTRFLFWSRAARAAGNERARAPLRRVDSNALQGASSAGAGRLGAAARTGRPARRSVPALHGRAHGHGCRMRFFRRRCRRPWPSGWPAAGSGFRACIAWWCAATGAGCADPTRRARTRAPAPSWWRAGRRIPTRDDVARRGLRPRAPTRSRSRC